MKTIFGVQSLSRQQVRWEDYLQDLTPVELHQGIWFKREDYFAPLGYGGINGSKLRQCIWMMYEYVQGGGKVGLVSGASVKSPQLPMGAAVAQHFGLPSVMVIGATTPESALKHENVFSAAWFGAKFALSKVAYNPNLQRMVKELQKQPGLRGAYELEYGITTTQSDEAIWEFHLLGARQVRNIPTGVKTLIIPAGSCNSCVSVLYGLVRYQIPVERVVLYGIGPTRLALIEERLAAIERVTRTNIRCYFRRMYHHHQDLAEEHNARRPLGFWPPYILEHYDLHETKYASYQDEMPASFDGIDFHPTYEGKVWRYIGERHPINRSAGDTCFWIVGSRPSAVAMVKQLRTLGDPPTKLPLYEAAQ